MFRDDAGTYDDTVWIASTSEETARLMIVSAANPVVHPTATMTLNYRKFCTQLIEALEHYEPLDPGHSDLITGIRACLQAETLLEAVGMEKELCNPLKLNGYTSVEQVLEADPKDLMECKGLGPDRVGRILAAIRKYQRESAMDDLRQASADVSGVELEDHFVDANKMVPQPISVSERLPGDQLCWWYEPDEDDGYGGMWTLLRIRGNTARYSHWLPAHALPLPSSQHHFYV